MERKWRSQERWSREWALEGGPSPRLCAKLDVAI